MTEKYCAFLRGVNVNGTAIKMEALRAAFWEMGVADARTVLASGNVVFSPPEDVPAPSELKGRIESGLTQAFRFDVHVFIRSGGELRKVLDAAQALPLPEGCHHYHLFYDGGEVGEELEKLFAAVPHTPDEYFSAGFDGASWIVQKGATLESAFGSKVLGSARYKSLLTSRNINTLQKVFKAIED